MPAIFRSVKVSYHRERIDLPDGDFLDLDHITTGSDRLLLLLHGLEGSSASNYIKGFARTFSAAGWNICAMNQRSCSGEMNRLLASYHSGATSDLAFIVDKLSGNNDYKQIVPVGFSLGGNILLKYLGEYAGRLPQAVQAAIAFSVPVDLGSSALKMAEPANRIYMDRFLRSLTSKMIFKSKQFPGEIDLKGIRNIRAFHEFDDRYTAPIHGFANAADYYMRCSSVNFLSRIRTRVLLVNALNDPFLGEACYPGEIAASSEYLFLEVPEKGGHVGFAENFPGNRYWSERRALTFIRDTLFH